MDDIIFRYLHFLGIIVFSAALFSEHLLLKREMNSSEIKKVAVLDLIYGVSALLVMAVGFVLWFWVGKPAKFYSQNPIFMVKITLFFVIAFLSIYPSVFFFKHRKTENNVTVPKIIFMLLRFEMILLLLIPLLAVYMAKGIGLS